MSTDAALQVIKKWWRLIAAAAVAGVLVSVALSVLIPTKYSATAQAFVSLAPRSATESDPFAGSQFVLQRMESYAELATSPQVLNAVVQKLGIEQTPEELRNHVKSTNPPNTVLLNVVVDNESARSAATIADAVVAQLARAIDTLEASGGPANSSPVRVTVIAPAPVPPAVSRARLLRNALIGLCAGLVVASCGALVDRYSTPRDPGPRTPGVRHPQPGQELDTVRSDNSLEFPTAPQRARRL